MPEREVFARGVEDGDVVCCELSAPNDAAAKLCRAGERTICVGRGDLNVDMEKCLVGVKLGDSVTLTAKIGDEEPVVTAEVKEIKVRKVPELNDEFAKTTGEGETVAELREATRKTLVEEEEERRKSPSMTRTRFPLRARAEAVFIEMKVLPLPG